MSDTLIWEQPPARRGAAGGTDKYDALTEQLKSRPGQWARVPEHLVSKPLALASSIRYGKTKAFQPEGSFEASARGEFVYARYVGDDAARRTA